MNFTNPSNETGFTLVELLVVILILGILIAIAVPTFLSQQDKGNDASVLTELNTAYKSASADAAFRSADYGSPADVVAAINKAEPELTAAQIKSVDAASVGTLGVVDATGGDLTLAEKSNSGHICTLVVTGHKLAPPSCDATGDATSPGGGNPDFTALGFAIANGTGGTVGMAEQGDTLTFTTSEPVDPQTVLKGWDGSPIMVTVSIWPGSSHYFGAAGNNTAEVGNNSYQTNGLGTIDLGSDDYFTGNYGGGALDWGLFGTPSIMTQSGTTIKVVLGTYGPGDTAVKALDGPGISTVPSIATWTPGPGLKDVSGNPITGGSVSTAKPQLYF